MAKIKRQLKKTAEPEEKTITKTPIQKTYLPDAIQQNYDYMRIGKYYVRVFALEMLPRQAYIGWLDEIIELGGVALSTHIEPIPDKDISAYLLRSETKARAQYAIDSQSGNIARMPQLEQEIEDYRQLREIIAMGQDRLSFITVYIALYCLSAEEMQTKTDILESILARKAMQGRCLYCRHIKGFEGILPFIKNPLPEYQRNTTAAATACCLPLTTAQAGHSTGILLGQNIYSGSPVLLDRFAGERIIPNQHLFICGVSGSGKSVSLREIALLEAYRGIKTALVDPEGEYVRFTKKLGGQVVSLKPGVFSGINPFDLEPEIDDNGQQTVNIHAKNEDVLAIIDSVYQYRNKANMSAQEAAIVEFTVFEMYKKLGITSSPASLYDAGLKKAMPTFSELVTQLTQTPGGEQIAQTIKPLTVEGSSGMFDGQTTLRLTDTPFICFNLAGLAGEFSKFIGIQAILTWLWQQFAQKGGKEVPKCVAVDEAWMFLRYKGAAQHLETLARRGRKHGCGLTIATQRFEEFTQNEEGKAVIESCATVLVLKQEEHAVNAAVDYFHLSDGCIPIITPPAPAGQGILRVSGNTTAIQIQPAPFEWELVETKLSR